MSRDLYPTKGTELEESLSIVKQTKNIDTPAWFQATLAAGYTPYIATSERLLPFFNTAPFGQKVQCYLLEKPEHSTFHEAYLLSNSLSYKSPDLKMPNWVLIDCVLMQTAII